MNALGSLGVLIPTRNSATLLPQYLDALEGWLALATEVVVVDSFSTDDTVKMLKARLRHPKVQFLTHPPGLYASWNFGIRHLQSDYTYIATVCDTITRAGMQQLLDAAHAHQSDVVVSKPKLYIPDGRSAEMEWPMDDIVRTLGIEGPRKLRRLEAVIFATVHAAAALTGSCASDLFRTACLKRFPFPTGFGTAADGMWSTLHAAELTWTMLPDKFSTFKIHPTFATTEDRLQDMKKRRPDQILSEAVQKWLRCGIVSPADLDLFGWRAGFRVQQEFLDHKMPYDRCRRGRLPWILNPRAWWLRTRREQAKARLHVWKVEALRAIGSVSGPRLANSHALGS